MISLSHTHTQTNKQISPQLNLFKKQNSG